MKKKKKKKRLLSLLMVFVMAVTMLAGCTSPKEVDDGKISISMYVWDRFMFKEFTPWLEQKFPDIEFTFIQSYNTMDYYKDLLDRGEDMPDIYSTTQMFTCYDKYAENLIDLSKYDVTGKYNKVRISQYELEGKIYLLPNQYNIPHTYLTKKDQVRRIR